MVFLNLVDTHFKAKNSHQTTQIFNLKYSFKNYITIFNKTIIYTMLYLPLIGSPKLEIDIEENDYMNYLLKDE